MSTRPLAPGKKQGFTLIEILIAMVILAVGLLALAAMGIGAARTLSIADRNSRAAFLAAQFMDDAVQDIHQNVTPVSCLSQDIGGGDRLTRSITISATPNLTPHVFTVTVVPIAIGFAPRPHTIRTYVFEPRVSAPSEMGTC